MSIEIFSEENRRPTPEMIVGNFRNIKNEYVKDGLDSTVLSGNYWMLAILGPPGSAKTTTRLYLRSLNVPYVELLYEDCLEDFKMDHPNIKGERYMSELESEEFVNLMVDRALQMHLDNQDKIIIAEFPSGMYRYEPDQAIERIIKNTKGEKGIKVRGVRKHIAIFQIEATQDVHHISDDWRDSMQTMTEGQARIKNLFEDWNQTRNAATSIQSMRARENHNIRLSTVFEEIDNYLIRRKLTLEYAAKLESIPADLAIHPADWERICKNWIALGYYYSSFMGGNKLLLAVNPAIEGMSANFHSQNLA